MKNKIIFKVSFLLSIIFTFICCSIIGLKEDILDTVNIKKIFFIDINNFVAEKSEFLQYVFIVFGFFIIYLLFLFVFKKVFKNKIVKSDKLINKILNIVIILIFLTITILAFCHFSNFYKSFFSAQRFIKYYYLPFYSFLIIILLKTNDKNKKIINVFFTIACFLLIITMAILYFSKYYDYSQNLVHHFNAYYYPILKVSSGLTIGVDFNSLYGMYPYVYVMFMKLFNLNGIAGTGIITSILVFLTFINLFYFLSKNNKNKLICFLVLLSIITFTSVYDVFLSKSLYIQYFPHRVFGISLILAYMSFYMKQERKLGYTLLGYIISSFAIFYNFETGIVVLLTWFAFNIYTYLYKNKIFTLTFLKKLLLQILFLFMSVVIYYTIVIIISYLRTGIIIKISSLLFGQNVFFNYGFFMLKAQKFGMWMIYILTILFTLAYSLKEIKDFRTKKPDYKQHTILFILSIISLGIFSYFQGRSHDIVFVTILYPILLIVGVVLDKSINNKDKLLPLLLVSIIIFFSFINISYFINFPHINTILFNKTYKKESVILKNINNLKDIKEAIPDLDFLLPYESYYYDYYNMKDVKKISSHVDIFMYEQIESVLLFLQKNKKSLITDEVILKPIKEKYKKELLLLLEKEYLIKKRDEYIIFVYKKDWEKIKSLENLKTIIIE